MFKNILQNNSNSAYQQQGGIFILKQSNTYLRLILASLDSQIDKRLVGTFFDVFATVLTFRNKAMGLLLSELGGYICGFAHAPAGTKRISNLLRSPKWSATLIDDFFFNRTKDRVKNLLEEGKRPLMLWDDSCIEKHESRVSEGLCSVFSSKAKRLTRIRPGFFTPPKGRICVAGYQWTGVFLSNLGGTPSVCQMSWWTTRGKFKEDPDNITFNLLRKIHQTIGSSVVHIFDRGYANEKMLRYLFTFNQLFIIRWKTNMLLCHKEKGCKQTHLMARSFKPQGSKIVYDKERKKYKRVSIAWGAVTHPEYPENQLFIVIARDRNSYEAPIYMLTSLPIENVKDAWEVLFSYIHRWEAEQGFRFLKSEMGLESPRLWFWDNRQKLMGIVTLVYDFLLNFYRNRKTTARVFLRRWCHRTGKRYRDASIPLYRIRAALSNCLKSLWFQNSG